MDRLVHRYLDRCGLIGVLVVNDILPLHSIAGMLSCESVTLAGELNPMGKRYAVDLCECATGHPHFHATMLKNDSTIRCDESAIAQYFEEKIVKKRSSAQIQNLLLYLKVEAWIVQSSAIESAGLLGN